jgi:hypothetical protein
VEIEADPDRVRSDGSQYTAKDGDTTPWVAVCTGRAHIVGQSTGEKNISDSWDFLLTR